MLSIAFLSGAEKNDTNRSRQNNQHGDVNVPQNLSYKPPLHYKTPYPYKTSPFIGFRGQG